jgi:hypothetical protein
MALHAIQQLCAWVTAGGRGGIYWFLLGPRKAGPGRVVSSSGHGVGTWEPKSKQLPHSSTCLSLSSCRVCLSPLLNHLTRPRREGLEWQRRQALTDLAACYSHRPGRAGVRTAAADDDTLRARTTACARAEGRPHPRVGDRSTKASVRCRVHLVPPR